MLLSDISSVGVRLSYLRRSTVGGGLEESVCIMLILRPKSTKKNGGRDGHQADFSAFNDKREI